MAGRGNFRARNSATFDSSPSSGALLLSQKKSNFFLQDRRLIQQTSPSIGKVEQYRNHAFRKALHLRGMCARQRVPFFSTVNSLANMTPRRRTTRAPPFSRSSQSLTTLTLLLSRPTRTRANSPKATPHSTSWARSPPLRVQMDLFCLSALPSQSTVSFPSPRKNLHIHPAL